MSAAGGQTDCANDPAESASDPASSAGDGNLLRAFLHDRDVACPQCGYNLRDQLSDRCPECGERIVLQLSLAEPKQKLLIAGLIGLCFPAGLHALLFIYIAVRITVFDASFRAFDTFVVLNAIELAVAGCALLLWLWKWRRIRRMSTLARRLLVTAAWGLALADVFVFAMYIR